MSCDVCTKELKSTDITMTVTASDMKHVPVGKMHRKCYIISFGIIRDAVYMGAWLNRTDDRK